MKVAYKELIECTLDHEYYPNAADGFEFAPIGYTAAALDRAGLLFRATPNGFSVLYQSIESDEAAEFVRPLPADLRLSFGAWTQTPHLNTISRIPMFNPKSQVLCRDNLTDRPRRLTGDDLVTVRPMTWKRNVEGSDVVMHQVADATGTVVDSAFSQPTEGRVSYVVDVDQPGRHRLTADNAEVEQFYAFADWQRPTFAVFDYYAGRNVPTNSAFVDAAGNPTPKHYRYRVLERLVTWRYYVIPKFNDQLNASNMTVVDTESRYTFMPAVESTTISGEKAFMFESNERIPVLPEKLEGISLQRTGKKDLVKDLANPEFREIRQKNSQFYAEMHVYV